MKFAATDEYSFDGLIGPSHNFAGLSQGNFPSQKNRRTVSNPKKAAQQGLAKMKLLMDLGIKQVVVPPQERPYLPHLHELGYRGTDRKMLNQVSHKDLDLLLEISSASSMWLANAATVSPSADTKDGRCHLTIANLVTEKHRSIEPPQTQMLLSCVLKPSSEIIFHSALQGDQYFDEGAANHMRITSSHDQPGLQIFVYGKISEGGGVKPHNFPARQSLEACQKIVKEHQLDFRKVLYIQQHPRAVDLGVFHNDLIATCNENVLLYHEMAFMDKLNFLKELKYKFGEITKTPLYIVEVKDDLFSIKDSVESYLFNSQIVSNERGMVMIAPFECAQGKANEIIKRIKETDVPINEVHYVDLKESMSNGGGPACLRLRMVLTEQEAKGIKESCLMTPELYKNLTQWIEDHYREKLSYEDLKDFELLKECRAALDQLTQMLDLGSVYSFQKA